MVSIAETSRRDTSLLASSRRSARDFRIVEFLGEPRAVGVHALDLGLRLAIVLILLQAVRDSVLQTLDGPAEANDHLLEVWFPRPWLPF